jgi:hypothetical protein
MRRDLLRTSAFALAFAGSGRRLYRRRRAGEPRPPRALKQNLGSSDYFAMELVAGGARRRMQPTSRFQCPAPLGLLFLRM